MGSPVPRAWRVAALALALQCCAGARAAPRRLHASALASDPAGLAVSTLAAAGADGGPLGVYMLSGLASDAATGAWYWSTPLHSVRVLRADGSVAVAAGTEGANGTTLGAGAATALNRPAHLAFDAGARFLYVADSGNGRILSFDVDNGFAATLVASGLPTPYGLALSAAGDALYVSSFGAHCVLRIAAPAGGAAVAAPFAGTCGASGAGAADGLGAAAQFSHPFGLAMLSTGALAVADYDNSCVRSVDVSTANVSTLAGACQPRPPTSLMSLDGPLPLARFFRPLALAADGAGGAVLSDFFGHKLRYLDAAAGTVSTLAGTGFPGGRNGAALGAQLQGPAAVALAPNGDAVFVDALNGALRTLAQAGPPAPAAPPATPPAPVDDAPARAARAARRALAALALLCVPVYCALHCALAAHVRRTRVAVAVALQCAGADAGGEPVPCGRRFADEALAQAACDVLLDAAAGARRAAPRALLRTRLLAELTDADGDPAALRAAPKPAGAAARLSHAARHEAAWHRRALARCCCCCGGGADVRLAPADAWLLDAAEEGAPPAVALFEVVVSFGVGGRAAAAAFRAALRHAAQLAPLEAALAARAAALEARSGDGDGDDASQKAPRPPPLAVRGCAAALFALRDDLPHARLDARLVPRAAGAPEAKLLRPAGLDAAVAERLQVLLFLALSDAAATERLSLALPPPRARISVLLAGEPPAEGEAGEAPAEPAERAAAAEGEAPAAEPAAQDAEALAGADVPADDGAGRQAATPQPPRAARRAPRRRPQAAPEPAEAAAAADVGSAATPASARASRSAALTLEAEASQRGVPAGEAQEAAPPEEAPAEATPG
jgi:hypothetical protein